MIALLSSPSAGNAVGILLNPPSAAVKWRVLRNLSGVFADQDADTLIYEGAERHIIDIAALDNGVPVFYQPFYWNGSSWSTAPAKSVTPGLTLVDRSSDPQSLIRDRLDLGLNGLIARGDLTHQAGVLPVMTASPQFEDTVFPVVTVHVADDSDDAHFLGDMFVPDVAGIGGEEVTEVDGYYSQYTIDIVAWSLNGDERKLLRKWIKTVLVANLQIFSVNEMEEIHLQFSDADDFETYNAPMYMARCSLRCLAPTVAIGDVPVVTDVTTTDTTDTTGV
jgi:hypothetical protein